MYTLTLEPSLIGFITTGKSNILLIFLIIFFLIMFFLNTNLIYLGVNILFLINNFLDNSLSIAIEDDITPE